MTNCHGLRMTALDGKKRLTDVATTAQLLRLIRSIPSPKAEPFKLYDIAVKEIKEAILKSQYQAMKGVNSVQLSLYFGVGKYISENTRNNGWGTGAIDAISLRLCKEILGLRGFSAASLKKMRIFYEEWKDILLGSSVATNELKNDKSFIATNDLKETISSVESVEIQVQYLSNVNEKSVLHFNGAKK